MTRIAWTVGIVYTLIGVVLAMNAAPLRRGLAHFPRHRVAGILLAAAAIGWTAILLWQGPLGWFEPYRRWLPYLAASVFALTILLVDALLAPRALGGLLLLAAAPVLAAIRWEPTPWRFILTSQAYLWVLLGMLLVFSPYRFRRACEWIFAAPHRARIIGGLITATGLLIIISG